jgi:signal transduction histidine kinase
MKAEDKPFLSNQVPMLLSETERMRILMEGVVGYSDTTDFSTSREDLNQIIKETIVLIHDQAHGKDIALEQNIPDGITINVNKNSMKQVFLNLFINALDATGKGGKLRVEAVSSDGKITVRVADTGSGIPEGKLEKIFEPFYSTKPQGTGLGLAIIKKAVTANGGTISVRSEIGKGTVFELIFKEA